MGSDRAAAVAARPPSSVIMEPHAEVVWIAQPWQSGADSALSPADPLLTNQVVDIAYHGIQDLQPDISTGSEASLSSSTAVNQSPIDDVEADCLVDSYYRNFHNFHPFLLPQKHFVRLYRDPRRKSQFKPLIAFMRFIGDIYASSNWSTELKDYAEACLTQAPPTDPILVQCRLLYSIALFWNDNKTDAIHHMDNAIRLALDLQMYQKDFPTKHGADDVILMECWRRTWWMLYIVNTYYAGTLASIRTGLSDVEATVGLPCEESDYESGRIPEPQTLQDFDNREFSPDVPLFSSFAYLVGAVRCSALAITEILSVTRPDSTRVIQKIDSILNAWLLLLPKNRKQVMAKTGEIDELMFQACLVIHVSIIGLHRPFSDLKFNPVENISSCARDPPLDTPTPELVNIHTLRVLQSVEDQVQLLALPTRKFEHSPFVTCMISGGMLALLSACKFQLKGTDLTIARNQVRVAIGCLNALGEFWARSARNVREIQTIARHVLGLVSDFSEEQRSLGLDISIVNADIPPQENYVDMCGWYNIPDLDMSSLWEANSAQ
ncbi:C6 zinc finger domain protein [Penicillium brasilianum]|uniref:C6 zinc finger domain protein n=1 Tax=Penicillium brasilianum TaxID=104259 RepID=A0A1S9RYV1_PENBI|nr:C6 zinc finger domain protein [Penicillium brasilianum]